MPPLSSQGAVATKLATGSECTKLRSRLSMPQMSTTVTLLHTPSSAGSTRAASPSIAHTGALAFSSLPKQPHNSYQVQVQADDGHTGGTDIQSITVNVAADKMSASAQSDTFVFHSQFGANTIGHFDPVKDFLQFDRGMFATDTPNAALAASHEDGHGNVIIDTHAGRIEI